MDKLLKLYDELENTYCPYKENRDRDTEWCEVCKNNICTSGYYEICDRINVKINKHKEYLSKFKKMD